jgi:hypothetical protein
MKYLKMEYFYVDRRTPWIVHNWKTGWSYKFYEVLEFI